MVQHQSDISHSILVDVVTIDIELNYWHDDYACPVHITPFVRCI